MKIHRTLAQKEKYLGSTIWCLGDEVDCVLSVLTSVTEAWHLPQMAPLMCKPSSKSRISIGLSCTL